MKKSDFLPPPPELGIPVTPPGTATTVIHTKVRSTPDGGTQIDKVRYEGIVSSDASDYLLENPTVTVLMPAPGEIQIEYFEAHDPHADLSGEGAAGDGG